jgi:PAS domain S-box-containing protein
MANEQAQELLKLQAAALKATANAVVITDREANIVWVNAAFEQLTGYSGQEAIGQSTRLLKSSVNSPSLYKDMWETILAGDRWQGDLVNRRKDGTLYVEEMTITPIPNQAGEIAHFVALKQDITKKKGWERELQFKTALLEAQTEATLDGILAVDEAAKIVLSNQHFATIWGIPPALIQAADDKSLLRYVRDQVEDPKAFLDKVDYLYSHLEEKSRDEVRLKDGRVLDRYSSPLIDATGAYRGRIWYFRDVTASKQGEEKLRRSEEQFRELAENVREVLFILNPESVRITYISPVYDEIWGRSRQELYDRPAAWIESVNADDSERVVASTKAARRGFSQKSNTELRGRMGRFAGYTRGVFPSAMRPASSREWWGLQKISRRAR